MPPRSSSSTSTPSLCSQCRLAQRLGTVPSSSRPTKIFASTVLGLWRVSHEEARFIHYRHALENDFRYPRVRCDLKDLPVASGPHPACSNCQERGLKCVDEFADVKAVKLLRRGRRLQQVEAIYGKGAAEDASTIPLPLVARLPSIIPPLKPEFFASSFWKWFSLQSTPSAGLPGATHLSDRLLGPILDPTEFPARFFAHTKGTHSLGNEGKILAHLLVVWAASFGIDERGLPETEEPPRPSSASGSGEGPSKIVRPGQQNPNGALVTERRRAERKNRTESMVQEILVLIDSHAIMRRPTWDGVRILLLILPLMEDISISSAVRRYMYEATLAQAASCVSPRHASVDAFDPARGITTGMRGGRFVLSDDDIDAFQNTIPAFGYNNSPHQSPVSPTFLQGTGHGPGLAIPHRLIHPQSSHPQLATPIHAYTSTADSFAIPLHLSEVCRRVYVVLTGVRAARRAQEGGGIDAEGMRNVWDGLEQCWEDFEALRCRPNLPDDFQMFISAWQLYIFECHNIIRETLKQYSVQSTGADASGLFSTAASPRSTSHGATYLPPQQLHAIASRKCLRLLPAVMGIMRTHLTGGGGEIFTWDAGLVRDGCFFAGFLCACIDNDAPEFAVENREFKHADMDSVRSALDTEEGIRLCLSALQEINWAFSRSEEREDTVRRIWEDKKKRKLDSHHHSLPAPYDVDYHSQSQAPYNEPPPPPPPSSYPSFPPKWVHDVDGHAQLPINLLVERPVLPPLNLLHHDSPPRHLIDSAPSTGYSVDGGGANGWPTYTPPSTATSGTSTSTGVSSGGSPVFASLASGGNSDAIGGGFKSPDSESNPFFNVTRDLDHFSFNASSVVVRDADCSPHFSPTGFLNPASTVFSVDSGVLARNEHSDMDGCPQFTDGCTDFYH
ncbi:Zn(2)-C6 fungal-type domain-containing protein [Mycena sanguinolenta]|uniref:Zn(2)-C6 fungal-type domain-containing protein n=1 Tax=Mycena sanguinolenta TaxID=230812 RepID=A0A8H6YJZ6_9AGAR|nr:Zn(2)-C6 fungal-type domain-containing protein [Mycena sanguinolenta]